MKNLKRIFTYVFLITGALFFNAGMCGDDPPVEEGGAAEAGGYVAITGEDFLEPYDVGVFGPNGFTAFYAFQANGLPSYVDYYDVKKNKLQVEFIFDDDGLPLVIGTSEYTYVFTNFAGNTFTAVVMGKDGKLNVIDDIEIDMEWSTYLKEIGSPAATRAATRSTSDSFQQRLSLALNSLQGIKTGTPPIQTRVFFKNPKTWKYLNSITSTVGCGLSLGSAAVSGGLATPLAFISCASAIATVTDLVTDGKLIPGPLATGLTIVSQVGTGAGCLNIINPADVASCIAGMVGWVTNAGDQLTQKMIDDMKKIVDEMEKAGYGSGKGNWDEYAEKYPIMNRYPKFPYHIKSGNSYAGGVELFVKMTSSDRDLYIEVLKTDGFSKKSNSSSGVYYDAAKVFYNRDVPFNYYCTIYKSTEAGVIRIVFQLKQ